MALKSVGQPVGQTGTVANNHDGTATYTPAAGVCNATDSFAYTLSDGHGMTDTGNVSVTVATKRTDPHLTLKASAATIPYGGTVTLTAHLASFVSGEEIAITRTPFGGTARPVASHVVDSTGTVRATVSGLSMTNSFRATSPRENCFAPAATGPVTVAVQARTTGGLFDYYATSGIYRLYHSGTAPLFKGAVAPNHGGKNVTFEWQQDSGGGWQSYFKQGVPLDSNSQIGIFLNSGAVQGPRYRVRIQWPGGNGNAASASPWAYFKVTS